MTTVIVFKKDTTWQQLLARHMNCNVKSINNILYTVLKMHHNKQGQPRIIIN